MSIAPRAVQRFEIVAVLGSGGMGTVYRAHDPQLGRDVALKVLTKQDTPRELSTSVTVDLRGDPPVTSTGLLGEARVMARLSHPNVLPIYEVGLAEDGAVFLVTELVDGTDLGSWLAEPRSTAAIVDAFAQAARGLFAAHAAGVIHRDIKPSNILIGRDGRVRVADFGIAHLASPASASMIRVDGAGTPRYMAPELLRGKPPSESTDVYALCIALSDAFGAEDPAQRERALRARDVEPRLRALIIAGTSHDPAERPELAELIAALEGRRPRRALRWLVVGGAFAGGLSLVLVAGLVMRDEHKSCAIDPDVFVGRYDPMQRMSVQVALARHGDALGHAGRDILATFDARRSAIESQLSTNCAELRRAQITNATYVSRSACLQRRAYELGAVVQRYLALPDDLPKARDRALAMTPLEDCVEIRTPAVANDRRAAEALWQRYIASEALAVPTAAAAHAKELLEIEARAKQLGELELAIRAELWLSTELRFLDKLAEADATLHRAYREATEINARELAIIALARRAKLAAQKNDAKTARQLGELAVDLANRPHTRAIARATTLNVLGLADQLNGDFSSSTKHLREALEIAAKLPARDPALEMAIRGTLLETLIRMKAPGSAMIELAKQTDEFSRTYQGEVDLQRANTLNILAAGLRNAGEVTDALAYRRQAIAIFEAKLPATHSARIGIHADYANDLRAAGKFEEARKELAWVIARSRQNETMRASLPENLASYAASLFMLGRHKAALAAMGDALEENISLFGKNHPNTWETRATRMAMAFDNDKLELAARDLESLEQSYHGSQEGNALRLEMLRGVYRSQLAVKRGRPRDAETLTRTALAKVDKLGASDQMHTELYVALGDSLAAQQRWANARDAYVRARALCEKSLPNPPILAGMDVAIAKAEAKLGHRSEAAAYARRALDVLTRYPGMAKKRKDAERLIRR